MLPTVKKMDEKTIIVAAWYPFKINGFWMIGDNAASVAIISPIVNVHTMLTIVVYYGFVLFMLCRSNN
jgi:hypothetical protein